MNNLKYILLKQSCLVKDYLVTVKINELLIQETVFSNLIIENKEQNIRFSPKISLILILSSQDDELSRQETDFFTSDIENLRISKRK